MEQLPQVVKFKSLTRKHVTPVRKIWKDRIGMKEKRINEWLSHSISPQTPTTGFVALANGVAIGFSIVTYSSPTYVNEYVNHPNFSIPSDDLWDQTGICEAIAVKQDWSGQSIGTELFKHELHYLYKNNVSGAIGMTWNRENNVDGRVLFEKIGFEEIHTHPQFYSTLSEDVKCIDCINGCECGASLYIKELCNSISPSEKLHIPTNQSN